MVSEKEEGKGSYQVFPIKGVLILDVLFLSTLYSMPVEHSFFEGLALFCFGSNLAKLRGNPSLDLFSLVLSFYFVFFVFFFLQEVGESLGLQSWNEFVLISPLETSVLVVFVHDISWRE